MSLNAPREARMKKCKKGKPNHTRSLENCLIPFFFNLDLDFNLWKRSAVFNDIIQFCNAWTSMHNIIDNEQKLTMLRNNLVFHAPKLIFDVIVLSQAVATSKHLKQNEN